MNKSTTSMLADLKTIFPESSWSWIIRALHQEPIIWQALHDPAFRDDLITNTGTSPTDWTPTRLGIEALNREFPGTIKLPVLPVSTLSSEIKEQISPTYQEFRDHPQADLSLLKTSLLALYLIHKYQNQASWPEIIALCQPLPAWKAPLTILYGIAPQQNRFLKQLPARVGLHILMSLPLPAEQLLDQIENLLEIIPQKARIDWIEAIHPVKPGWASRLAKTLLSSRTTGPRALSTRDLQQSARLYAYAKLPQQAQKDLSTALDLQERTKAQLLLQINQVKAQEGDIPPHSQTWKQVLEIVRSPDKLQDHIREITHLLDSLLNQRHTQAAGNLLENIAAPYPPQGSFLAAAARTHLQKGQIEKARHLALQALGSGIQKPTCPHKLGTVLYHVQEFEKCIQVYEEALPESPNHPQALTMTARAYYQLGKMDPALDYLQIAVHLAPEQVDTRRLLASYLEEHEAWERAFQERQHILKIHQQQAASTSKSDPIPPLADHQALARCAVRSQKPKQALQICENILADHPGDGLTQTLLGESYLMLGKTQKGTHALQKAIELSPEHEQTWLSLASHQQASGAVETAIQTLSTGIKSAEKQTRLTHKLGRLHCARGEHTKALEAFRAADQRAKQDPTVSPLEKSRIQIQIGKSLHQLGHLQEARETLSSVVDRFPLDPEAALAYGQLLLSFGEPRGALPFLTQVVEGQPNTPEPYLALGQAHLALDLDPRRAVRALVTAVEKDPEPKQALGYLAQAYYQAEEFQSAQETYQQALNTSLKEDPDWSPRLYLGAGQTYRKMGKTNTALTLLQEGYKMNPENIPLIKELIQAYRENNTEEKALALLQSAFELAPEQRDILTWIADVALELEAHPIALPVLKAMLELAPRDSDPYLKIGRIYQQTGKKEQAVKTYADLLRLETPAPEALLQAGKELLELGQIEKAKLAFQRTVQICDRNPTAQDYTPQAYAELASCHRHLGQQEKALEYLDKTISADLNNPIWRKEKADLLMNCDRPQAALASLKHALDLAADDPEAHYRAAQIYRQVGELFQAFQHAQKAHDLYAEGPQNTLPEFAYSLVLAAELASLTLQTHQARELLEKGLPTLLDSLSDRQHSLLEGVCLYAELLLEEDQEVEAAQILNDITPIAGDSPRVKCLQARLTARQGDLDQARILWTEILSREKEDRAERKSKYSSQPPLAELFAYTAAELDLWDQAVDYAQRAVEQPNSSPRACLGFLKSLVFQAERFLFGKQLEIINHIPDHQALSPQNESHFEEMQKKLQEMTGNHPQIRKWFLRGEAVFWPSKETIGALNTLPEEPDNLTAYLLGLMTHHGQEKAAAEAKELLPFAEEHSLLAAHIALSLAPFEPRQALKAVKSVSPHYGLPGFPPPLVQSLKACIAEGAGLAAQAYDHIQHALSLWEEEPRWHTLAARTAPEEKEALKHWQRAIELEPDHVDHYLGLGHFHEVRGNNRQAISTFQKATELAPDAYDLWLTLSRCYQEISDLNKAYDCVTRAYELAPEQTTVVSRLAKVENARGHVREAERLLETLLDEHTQDPHVLLDLADIYQNQQKYPKALEALDRAQALQGDSLSLDLRKVNLLRHVEGLEASLQALGNLAHKHPQNFEVLSSLTTLLADAGDNNQAMQIAQKALNKDRFTKEQRAQLHTFIGRLLRQSGHLDQAVYHLHKATSLNNQDAEVFIELGRTEQDRRQPQQAFEAFHQAVQLAPKDPMAYYHAGIVLKELNEYRKAEHMLRKASQLAPHDLRIHRQLGVLVTLNLVHGEVPA